MRNQRSLILAIFAWLAANVCAAFFVMYALSYYFSAKIFAAAVAACVPLSIALLPLAIWRIKHLVCGEERSKFFNIFADAAVGFSLGGSLGYILLRTQGDSFADKFFPDLLAISGTFGVVATAAFVWLLSKFVSQKCGAEEGGINFCAIASAVIANILALALCMAHSGIGGFWIFAMAFCIAEIPYIFAVIATAWAISKFLLKCS